MAELCIKCKRKRTSFFHSARTSGENQTGPILLMASLRNFWASVSRRTCRGLFFCCCGGVICCFEYSVCWWPARVVRTWEHGRRVYLSRPDMSLQLIVIAKTISLLLLEVGFIWTIKPKIWTYNMDWKSQNMDQNMDWNPKYGPNMDWKITKFNK
jgi:hypothetical protein